MKSDWIAEARPLLTHPFTEEPLPLEGLRVDVYQRPQRSEWITKIVEGFDPAQANAIHVSERPDGSLWVIDGQHTLGALRKVGLPTWNCRIHRGLTRQDEARMFRLINKHSHRPSGIDDFRAALVEGDPVVMHIDAVLADFGLYVVGSHETPGDLLPIRATTGFFSLYRRGGEDLLRATMTVCSEAWHVPTYMPSETYNARLLPGIGLALMRSAKLMNRTRLVNALSRHRPPDLEQKYARGQQGHDRRVAQMTVDFYNGDDGGLRRLRSNSTGRIALVKGSSAKKTRLFLDA